MAKVITSQEEFESQCAASGCTFPLAATTETLKAPLKIGKCTVPNRIVYQPMEGCDGEANGAPGERTICKYMDFAKSGAGMIWFEATAVCDEGKANPRQLRLTEATKDAFAELVRNIKSTAKEPFGFEPFHLVAVVYDVAEAVESSGAVEFFFGFADGGYYSEAESGSFIYFYFHHIFVLLSACSSFGNPFELFLQPFFLLCQ